MPWFKRSAGADVHPDGLEPPAPPTLPTVEPLRDDEVAWVRSTIAELDEQDVRRGDIDDLGRHYDELLTVWLRLDQADRPDPDRVISQVGLAFGQHLADRAGLQWGVATRGSEVEIALHGVGRSGPVVLFPAEMVAQRWAAHQTGVLPSLARTTIESVGGAAEST